jgi:hypothetical protein
MMAPAGLPFLLHPFTGSPIEFRKKLERGCACRLGIEFLGYIQLSSMRLPVAVRWAIEDLFARPSRYQSDADIAIEAGLSERTLRRIIEGARLGTPHKLVTVARILHGYIYLRDANASLLEGER